MLKTFYKEYKAWIFPLILFCIIVILTAFKISGSSVGEFNTYLGTETPGLILNKPQAIRSDEWEVNTPITVSQAANGFPKINQDIGNGQDMSLVGDAPYKEWSGFFKPQNWPFFILPLEYAFAFKWWLIGCLVMISCYAFCLELLPKKYLLASLVAIALFLSPFVQWWYQAGTLAMVSYSFFILTVIIKMFKKETSKKALYLYTALLTYLLTALCIILYIPFLLPCIFVCGTFLIGHLLNNKNGFGAKFILKRTAYTAVAAVTMMLIMGLFLKTRPQTVALVTGTVYPGDRKVVSGGYKFESLMGGAYNLQLQIPERAKHAPMNQSESSNFLLIFPFLLPAFYFIKKRILDWRILLLTAAGALFALHMFVGKASFLASITGLNLVPHNRLLMGFGLINFLVLVVFLQTFSDKKARVPGRLALSLGLCTFILTIFVGNLLKRATNAAYIQSGMQIITVSLVVGSIVFLLAKKRFIAALTLYCIFSFVSIARIHPLQSGLHPIVGSNLSESIKRIGNKNPDAGWVVGEHGVFENFAMINGFRSVSGVYLYPQLDLWEPIGRSPADKDIYNRYAHVFFTIDDSLDPTNTYFDPPALDAFRVHTSPCSDFLRKNGVKYILTASPLTSSCITLIDTVPNPLMTMEIYEIR